MEKATNRCAPSFDILWDSVRADDYTMYRLVFASIFSKVEKDKFYFNMECWLAQLTKETMYECEWGQF